MTLQEFFKWLNGGFEVTKAQICQAIVEDDLEKRYKSARDVEWLMSSMWQRPITTGEYSDGNGGFIITVQVGSNVCEGAVRFKVKSIRSLGKWVRH